MHVRIYTCVYTYSHVKVAGTCTYLRTTALYKHYACYTLMKVATYIIMKLQRL